MEHPSISLLALFCSLVCINLVLSLPTRTAEDLLQDASDLVVNKRPKYMDTRRDLDVFKDLVLMSVQELVDEGRIDSTILPEESKEVSKPIEKRRYMGLCIHRQANQFIPFPCLRTGR